MALVVVFGGRAKPALLQVEYFEPVLIDFLRQSGILMQFQPLSHVSADYLIVLTTQQNKGLGVPTKAGRYLSL
jgi:hypothetical protein